MLQSVRWSLLAAFGALAVFLPHGVSAGPSPQPVLCDDPIMTADGAVQGTWGDDSGTCEWLGLPYAAPPVEALRWRPPQSTEGWEGIRQADRWAPRCAQKSVMELVNFDPSHQMSEDCLYLNVWRPQTPGPHPVMVWYHGGGLFGGTANSPFYKGERLAAEGDVVVVTLNYRLAIFGYLATSGLAAEDANGSAGNYGLLDQIQALKWVQANIAGFGGDPDNVTIFGESAGGWSVCNLMTSPLAEGLFHKAIMQSGGCSAATTLQRGLEIGERVAEAVGCDADDVQCMRAVDTKRVMRKGIQPELKGFEWQPRIDGWAVMGRPADLIAEGRYHDVPFLAGANRDEVKVAVLFNPSQYLDTSRGYERRLTDKFGASAAPAIAGMYQLSEYGRPAGAYRQLMTDAALLCPTFNGLMQVAERQPKTFLYRFDYDDFRFGRLVGAAHGMEVPFVFGNLKGLPTRPLYGPLRLKRAEPLADAMVRYWTTFAHTGDPNRPDLPPWPAFQQQGEVMHLDEDLRHEPLDGAVADRCLFWDELAASEPWLVETMGLSSGAPGRERPAAPVHASGGAGPGSAAP